MTQIFHIQAWYSLRKTLFYNSNYNYLHIIMLYLPPLLSEIPYKLNINLYMRANVGLRVQEGFPTALPSSRTCSLDVYVIKPNGKLHHWDTF